MILNKNNNLFIAVLDILFIMILCFITLLSAMLMQGEVIGGMKYSINITTFAITILGLGIYLCFILPQSDKGLKVMIQQLYGEAEEVK